MIRAALKNPYLVIVLVLMVTLIGLVSMVRIPADLLPTFETSAMQIVCFYPGMPPEVMEQDIMSRLQRWTGQAAGIEHQEAKAMQGVCVVKDFFQEHVTQADAISQVSALAMSDMFYLPPGTIPPMVMPFDPTASVPLCLVSVSNPDMTESELYDVAYKNLRNNLQSISGVIAPAVYGGTLRRILAYVDPAKLRAHNISMMEVHAALRQQNVLIPAGSARIQNTEFYIYTNAIPDKVAELNAAPIKTRADGSQLTFADIGEVKDARQIPSNKVRVNNRTLVYVPVYRQPGSNTIEIVDRIRVKLDEILGRLKEERKDDPKMKSLTLNLVMDQSVEVRKSVRALIIAAVLGALFAGLVVLLFLRELRSTLVIVLAIPISILTSLIGLYFFGHTINAMTLGGLALAVGILVDQAIVVIDNIERHMRMGTKGPLTAAFDGTREVAIPLLVSTATFMVVFFPVLFLSGLSYFLFMPLAAAVIFAIAASYLIAMFFVPVAAAKLLKPSRGGGGGAEDIKSHGWLVRGYRVSLLGALSVRWLVLVGAGVLFVVSLWLMTLTGSELFPPVDSGQFTIYVRMPSGTRLEETEKRIKQIENSLVEHLGDPAPANPQPYPHTFERFATKAQKEERSKRAKRLGKREGEVTLRLTPEKAAEAEAASKLQMLISNMGVLMDWPAAYTPNTGPMDAFVLLQFKDHTGLSVFEVVAKLRESLNEQYGPDGTHWKKEMKQVQAELVQLRAASQKTEKDLEKIQQLKQDLFTLRGFDKTGVEFAFDTGGILTAALNQGEPSPIHLQLAGRSTGTADEIMIHLMGVINGTEGQQGKVPGATDVRKAQRYDYPKIEVLIDRTKAKMFDLTPEEVIKNLVSATNSSINFDPAFWIDPSNGNHYFMGAQYYEEHIKSLETLKKLLVTRPGKPPIYLEEVAAIKTNEVGPAVINHRNITRVTDVYVNVKEGHDLGSVVGEIESRLYRPGLLELANTEIPYARIQQIVDQHPPLTKLARAINWNAFQGTNGQDKKLREVPRQRPEPKKGQNPRKLIGLGDLAGLMNDEAFKKDDDLSSFIENLKGYINSPLILEAVPDTRSAVAKYPTWFQKTLSGLGLTQPTKYAVVGAEYAGFSLQMQGEIRSMRDSFVDFGLGLVLAAILVYLVMVGQFRSWIDPLIVMVTVPLGFIGVAAILLLTGTRLNIQSFMGIIMMVGIVVEYTIVLMDFASHRLKQGVSVREAIVEAGTVRLRPILMTSMTTILALTPMAFGFAGGEADAPLARTIIGGVIAATVLPMFVVPCLYVMIKRPPKSGDEEVEPGWA